MRIPGIQRRFWRAAGWLSIFAGCCIFTGEAESPGGAASLEYRVKAGYLFNFTKYVSWPSQGPSLPDMPIVIGILGTDPFGAVFDEIVSDKVVNGHPVTVRRGDRPQALFGAQLVFIGRSEEHRLDRDLAVFKGRPILTVSDISQFAQRGGMVGFVIVNDAVRFEVNQQNAEGCGLKISARMLSAAIVVY